MAHYYVDFVNPPPFGESLPGAIGYLSKGGLTILYGQKTRGDIQRQCHLGYVPKVTTSLLIELQNRPVPKLKQPDGPHNWQPHPSVIVPKVLAKMKKEYLKPKDFSSPRGSPRQCEICDTPETKRQVTRHHVTPRFVRKIKSVSSRGIRWVCRPCHTEIHKLFSHEELTALDWDQVVLFMRNV